MQNSRRIISQFELRSNRAFLHFLPIIESLAFLSNSYSNFENPPTRNFGIVLSSYQDYFGERSMGALIYGSHARLANFIGSTCRIGGSSLISLSGTIASLPMPLDEVTFSHKDPW